MFLNKGDPRIEEKLRREVALSAVVQAVAEMMDDSPEPFALDADAVGFDVQACSVLPSGLPNRTRLKIFSPRPGHILVFFYKRSLVPYSHDRYSYGGFDLRTDQVERREVEEWLSFVGSGFHPDRRPSNLRRAFPYEIPE